MAKIAILTNIDPLVESKANFFADYFHFFVSQLGSSLEFEVENFLSLVDNILFQLENNAKNCAPTVKCYLSHPYLSDEDEYLSDFNSFADVKAVIENWKIIKSKQLVADSQIQISKFKRFRDELSEKMVRKSLEAVISMSLCSHTLARHKNEIKAHTKILVSEYIFKGRDQKYLSEVFGKILSKDIKEFPFPENINSQEEKKSYIISKGLVGQFNAIFDFMENAPPKRIFYYRVYGADFPKDYLFTYNEVTFYSREHLLFNEIRNKFDDYFEGDNFFIAAVPITIFSESVAFSETRIKIRRELKYLSSTLDREFSLDHRNNYLVSWGQEFAYGWGQQQEKQLYDNEKLVKLNNNPHYSLVNLNNKAKEFALSFEHLYVSAEVDTSMPGYWHYLETLFSSYKRNINLNEIVSTISIINEAIHRKEIIYEELANGLLFATFNSHKFPLTNIELHRAIRQMYNGIIPEEIRTLDYPFIQDMISFHDYQMTPMDYKKSQAYYSRLLTEAYAQRNAFIHQGISIQKSHFKLLYSLPPIISRLRFLLFEEIKRHSVLEFNDLVDGLLKKANQLLEL